MKNRQSDTIIDGWARLDKQFENSGVKPSTYIMGNETSTDLKIAMESSKGVCNEKNNPPSDNSPLDMRRTSI